MCVLYNTTASIDERRSVDDSVLPIARSAEHIASICDGQISRYDPESTLECVRFAAQPQQERGADAVGSRRVEEGHQNSPIVLELVGRDCLAVQRVG